jgi:hypothetical protein
MNGDERERRIMSTYTALTAPTQFVEANGIRFAYRRFGNARDVRHATGRDTVPASRGRVSADLWSNDLLWHGHATSESDGCTSGKIQLHERSSDLVFPTLQSGNPTLRVSERDRLSDEFFREILAHPIPTDMEAAKALSCSPAALDLFTWLSYRCFVAKGRERVPLFGDTGLVSQLGSADYSRPRKFRERLEGWLDLVRALWPECPAKIDDNGTGLWVDRASAVLTQGVVDVRR